ncbi:MAG TPA: Clp protease ClpP, partial [Spirochaetia bacterium]|nr:Clp protease ClpP [Spirochaetia bacterium]
MKTVKLSGTIGLDLMASDFDESLRGAAGEDIEIAIASPGGSVFDGIEIYNSIREHKRNNPGAKITIRIVGLAASMASYIASVDAADKVIAEDNAVFMIHNPWIAAVGDHREMAKNSEFLKGLSNILAQSYARKTKKSISAINGMMDAETWLYGDEIKEAGFVDEIIQSTEGSQASSKTTALALAKTRFSDSLAKIKRNADAEQEKAAAMLPAFFAGSGEPRMTETKATIDPMQAAINEALLAKLTEELGRSQGIEPLRPGRIAGAEYLEDEPE